MKKFILRAFLFSIIFTSFNNFTYCQYYDGTNGLTGASLKSKLHQIISNHTTFSYSEVKDILRDVDEDPNNSNNVILIYSRRSISKDDFASNNEPDFWNREHVWAKSHGFPDEADTAYTDVHHLRPCDATINSSRSNKDFNNVEHSSANEQGEAANTYTNSDYWEPADEVKGDVARMMFYMDVRYHSGFFNLKLVDRQSFSGDPELGILYTLIKWHNQDPVSQIEIDRNDGIFNYQENRNPFIDHPEWVGEIFGNNTDPLMILNTLSFNNDFGTIAVGDNLVQSYKLNTYNLSNDINITVESPFSLSIDNTNWSNEISISLSNIDATQEFNTIYVKYEPTTTGINSAGTIIHSTTGGNKVSLEIKGKEGTVDILTIAEARTKANGESVLVTGVVIDAGNNSGNSRVIYDGTAGIVVRSFDPGNESANLVQGDSIQVSGILAEYNNLLQIEKSPILITILKQGAELPLPQEVAVGDINEGYESELVKISGVRFIRSTTFQGAGAEGNFTVTDGTNDIICRIGSSSHPLVGTQTPNGNVDIIGFVGQFGSDYQISPRTAEDIVGGVTTSVSENIKNDIVVFPNPTKNELNIKGLDKNNDQVRISIINSMGQIVYNQKYNESIINTSALNNGLYYLMINSKNIVTTRKFIKK